VLKQHEHPYFEYRGQTAVRQGDWKYYRDDKGGEALYDLASDRHEDHDVKDAYPDIFTELKACVAREHADYATLNVPGP